MSGYFPVRQAVEIGKGDRFPLKRGELAETPDEFLRFKAVSNGFCDDVVLGALISSTPPKFPVSSGLFAAHPVNGSTVCASHRARHSTEADSVVFATVYTGDVLLNAALGDVCNSMPAAGR